MLKRIIEHKDLTKYLLTLLGAVVALTINTIQEGRVNDDFVLYHEVSRLFASGQWQAGIKLYNWPLYPALLAMMSKSGLSIYTSAQLLNVSFFTLTTYILISIIEQVGGTKREMTYGSLLLFSSPYIVGSVLPMLIRDQGFWAFFLVGILFFLKYIHSGKLSHAVLWQLSMLVALLFRIEAVTFLILLPIGILFLSRPNRLEMIIKSEILNIFVAIVICLGLVLHPSLHLSDMGRLQEVISIFHHNYIQISEVVTSKSELMAKYILGSFLDDYSLISIIITLISIVIIKAASTPGWITTLLAAYKFRDPSLAIDQDSKRIMIWGMALALINASMIILSTFILSGRYLISFALIVVIVASFSLAKIANNYRDSSRTKKLIPILLILALILSGIKNMLPKSSAHNYELESVNWLKTENIQKKPVFYVSPRARYYAGEQFQGRGYNYWEFTTAAIHNHSIENYEYLLINFDNNYHERESLLKKALPNYSLIKEFHGVKDKNKIMIFRKNHD